jgi:glycosyltransferase involved in cell wall biosynthesis
MALMEGSCDSNRERMIPAVLHVTTLHGGGVDRHLRDLARGVGRAHVFWHAGDSADLLEFPARRRCVALDPARIDADEGALAATLRHEGVGLVHLHSMAACARRRATQAARALGLRTVVTLHDVLFLRPDAFDRPPGAPPDARWLEGTSATLREAAAVVAPSRFIAALAARHAGIEANVVPNGSASARPGPPIAPRAGFEAHRPRHVVAVLGAIGPHKGSDLLEALPAFLAGTDIGVVVIGYLDRQLHPGWRVPGRLFVHGAYEDEALPALLAAYGARLVLFPGAVEESFSYALSDAWTAGVPVLAAPLGALAERIGDCACGLLLPEGFDARAVAVRLRHVFAHTGPSGLAELESALSRPDPARVPSLDSMARSLDAFYRRFAIDPAAPHAADADALQRLLAAGVDGSVFRQELVRLADEYAQVKAALEGERGRTERFEAESRGWIAKLEGDIAALQAELGREVAERRSLGEANAHLQVHKDAFDLLPRIVRRILLKRIADARS